MGERTIVVVSKGAKKGAKYHLPRCAAGIKIINRRQTTIGRAKKDGYLACMQCTPT